MADSNESNGLSESRMGFGYKAFNWSLAVIDVRLLWC